MILTEMKAPDLAPFVYVASSGYILSSRRLNVAYHLKSGAEILAQMRKRA